MSSHLSMAMAPRVSMLAELMSRYRRAVKLHHTTPNTHSLRAELTATKGSTSSVNSRLERVRLKTNLLLGVRR